MDKRIIKPKRAKCQLSKKLTNNFTFKEATNWLLSPSGWDGGGSITETSSTADLKEKIFFPWHLLLTFKSLHPWIFPGTIQPKEREEDGELSEVWADKSFGEWRRNPTEAIACECMFSVLASGEKYNKHQSYDDKRFYAHLRRIFSRGCEPDRKTHGCESTVYGPVWLSWTCLHSFLFSFFFFFPFVKNYSWNIDIKKKLINIFSA